MLSRLDMFCFGKIVHGLERMGWNNIVASQWQTSNVFASDAIPLSWEHWAQLNPAAGVPEDMVRFNGTWKANKNEHEMSHAEAAWAFMRRDYYSDVPHPLLDTAVAAFQTAYDAVAQYVTSRTNAWDAKGADWVYRWPSLGFLKPPAYPAFGEEKLE